MVFTVQRYPIAVTFRLSKADAARLDRLLNRYGTGLGIRGDSARFRLMLKNIDKKLLSPWDPTSYHEAFRKDEEGNEAENLRFQQLEKQKAQKRAAAQRPPPDPNDPTDDRNWFTEEEKEEEDSESEN